MEFLNEMGGSPLGGGEREREMESLLNRGGSPLERER